MYKNYYILKFIQNYNLTLYFLKYYKSRFNDGISILSSLIYSVFEGIKIKSLAVELKYLIDNIKIFCIVIVTVLLIFLSYYTDIFSCTNNNRRHKFF